MTIGRWAHGSMALAVLLAQPVAAFAQAAPPRAPAAPATRSLPATGAMVKTYVTDKKVPGMVVVVGGPTWTSAHAAGRTAADSSAPAATVDTLWRVYSMTKPITGIAAMMLVEDGKLKLDQPISDFIPAFKSMKVLTDPDNSLASRAATKPITVRNLLTHTAGLGYTIVTKGPLLKEYERLGIVPAAINAQTEVAMAQARPKSLEEFANRVASLPLIAEPGTKWSYSIGLDVMGRVIEVASGMSFERFLQTRMFDPLGMTSTYWQVPEREKARLATNYAWAGDTLAPVDPAATSVWLQKPSFPYGGAGLAMSARDYDRFLHMLQNGGTLDGKRVMKAETVALAMSNLLPDGVTFGGVDGATGGQAGPKMGFGAGGSVYLETLPGRPGKGTYGWGGAAGTVAFVDPVRQLRGTVMVNYFPADRFPLREDLVKALASDLAGAR
ncbi:serine hydrolase [Sphingomonas sp. Leaf24]|uniref:serine hydrolase domain-containing protein n=1 Tax=unclassified Sphingomonas TaxID=196159 RepID=UPI0006F2B7C6|nr:MULTISPECIES: serine hydrolase domain-containing protein [unclassified Sphingomonas]KQM23260.1 serine hydrolase [Sphingomonas sp. Leaf5]KQM96119.1 serine hydrolase [Sphingomonas sp. Leaf24]